MKKYVIFSLLVGMVLSFSPARAEENDTFKSRREEFKEEMKTKREAFISGLKKDRDAFLAELKAKKEEWKNTNRERRAEFCGKAKQMIGKRFETVMMQLERFQTKVEEIIDKLEADGKDTTLAEEALALSKSKLAEAKVKLAEIKELVPETCADVTPETFEKIKLGARGAKDLLKESRENLHQAIKEIKALREKSDDEDSDTETQ